MNVLRGTPVWAAALGAGLGLAAGAALFGMNTPASPILIALCGLLGLLCAIDVAKRLLPNPLVATAAVLTWAAMITDAVAGSTGVQMVAMVVIFSVLAMIFITGLLAAASYLSGGGVGLGDMKLAAAISPLAVFYGMDGLWAALATLAAGSAIVAGLAVATKRKAVAFGPVIVLSVAAAVWAG